MDVRLSTLQTNYLFNKEKEFKAAKGKGSYTEIGRGQHFSWQGEKQVVVGEDAPPKRHQNFKVAITSALVVTVTADGGGIPAASIDTAELVRKVTSALKARLKLLIEKDHVFNNLGRTGQQLEFHKNPIVNRHDSRWLLIGIGHAIKAGESRTLAIESVRGFCIYQPIGTADCYYRNYDIRDNVELEYEEPIRLLHIDKDVSKGRPQESVQMLRNSSEVPIAPL